MSHRKSDLGIPCPRKTAKVVLDTLASIGSTIKTCRTTTTKPNVMNMANYPSVYFSSAVGGPFPIFLAMALFKLNPSGTFGFSGNLTTDRRGVHFDVPPDRLATDRWCDKHRSVPAFVRLLTAASVTLSRDIRHTPISLVFLLRGMICYRLSGGYPLT